MFIKKDLRKIVEILADPNDKRENLKLSKRIFEFQSGLRCICKESNLPSLENLKAINLYDNCLDNLQGIGLLSQTPLVEINLGNNRITSIPFEVSLI